MVVATFVRGNHRKVVITGKRKVCAFHETIDILRTTSYLDLLVYMSVKYFNETSKGDWGSSGAYVAIVFLIGAFSNTSYYIY